MKQSGQQMMMQLLPDCQSLPLPLHFYISRCSRWTSLTSRSAVNLGYLSDPFVSHLYRPKYGESSHSGSRKPPLINVGTHHRTWAIDLLVDQFLERGGKQVVSLGAGSDTRFWRLMVCLFFLIRSFPREFWETDESLEVNDLILNDISKSISHTLRVSKHNVYPVHRPSNPPYALPPLNLVPINHIRYKRAVHNSNPRYIHYYP
jgi:hypothetical protein